MANITTVRGRLRSSKDRYVNWTTADPVLDNGEVVIVYDITDSETRQRLKIGNGTSVFSELPWFSDWSKIDKVEVGNFNGPIPLDESGYISMSYFPDDIKESSEGIIRRIPVQSGILYFNGSEQTPTWEFYNAKYATVSGTTSATNVGKYTVTFTPNTGYKWSDNTTEPKTSTWSIKSAHTSNDTLPYQSAVITYSGRQITPTWSNYKSNELSISGESSGTNAGSYTAIFTPKSGYTWYDGSTDPVEIEWIINRKSISVPTLKNQLTYTGSSQSPEWNYYNPDQIDLSGDRSATATGIYATVFTPKSNFQWADGSTLGQTVTWSIGKSRIADLPTQSVVLEYTGAEQTVTWNNYDPNKLTITGPVKATDAGIYNVTFKPKAGEEWFDGTTSAKTVSWSINRGIISALPAQTTELVYNAANQSPAWDSNYSASKMSVLGITLASEVGSYVVQFTPNSNYKWSDGSIESKSQTWVIKKGVIATLPEQSANIPYSGSAKTVSWKNYDSAKLSVTGDTTGTNAGMYSAFFTPRSNYEWFDGTTTPKEVLWQIGMTQIPVPTQYSSVTYNGTSRSPSWNNYNSTQLDISGTTSAVDAGTYTVSFTPKAGYQWTDGTSTAKSVQWTLLRQVISIPTTQSLTYTGSTQNPYQNQVASNSAYNVSGNYTATDVGDYTVYFTPKTNYMWSDNTATSKEIIWHIVQASVTVPSQYSTIYYADGSRCTPSWSSYDSTKMSISGSSYAYNVGTYTATFTLNNPTNYKWSSDGTSTPKDVTWRIYKKSLSVPSPKTAFTFNESYQSVEWNYYPVSGISIYGDTSGYNAGTYIASFYLTDTDNYQWSDGTIVDKNVNWYIYKKSLPYPTQANTTIVYDGTTQYPEWNNYNSSQLNIDSANSTLSAVNAGTYNVRFTPTDNYTLNGYTAATVSWKINKATPNITLSQDGVMLGTNDTVTVNVTSDSDGALSVSSSYSSIASVTLTKE